MGVKFEAFHIEFGQKWSVYAPGDTVSGRVTMRLAEGVFCDQIVAQCFGSLKIMWIETELKPPHGLRSVAYNQEKVYFDLKSNLWSKNSSETKLKESQSVDKLIENARTYRLRIPASSYSSSKTSADSRRPILTDGTHHFDFSFQLPDELPTSYDASHSCACIRYFIKVNILEEERIKHSRKEYFTVVKEFDLRKVPRAMQPSTVNQIQMLSAGSKFLCCCVTGGDSTLSVMGTLQKFGYVPGEQVKISAEIENHSNISVQRLKARLMQHTLCIVNTPESRMKESAHCVSHVVMNRKIKPGGMFLWDGQPALYIPAVTPTFTEKGALEVSYSVVVDVFIGKTSPVVTLQFPLLIGTVPTSMTPPNSNRQTQDSMCSAPPAYDEAAQCDGAGESSALAPPDYQTSVLGLTPTATGATDDSFLPRYAVYSHNALGNVISDIL